MFVGGSGFETQPPAVKDGKIVPYPPTGYRTLNARFWFFYIATGVTPAMCMMLPDMGSQYLVASYDSKKQYFDGAKNYRCTLPPNIPENNFWSFTVYDNQTRSMLQTPQRFPRAGSQSFPSPAAVANADGSVDIYFGPEAPGRQGDQLDPDHAGQGLVHDPAALQPARVVLRQELEGRRDRGDQLIGSRVPTGSTRGRHNAVRHRGSFPGSTTATVGHATARS